ncbi:hypothetical protein BHM03_00048014 [Ensete ventricosum]|nr:hypothetical protein BHM03_00048014 [Ensete ventricosum]
MGCRLGGEEAGGRGAIKEDDVEVDKGQLQRSEGKGGCRHKEEAIDARRGKDNYNEAKWGRCGGEWKRQGKTLTEGGRERYGKGGKSEGKALVATAEWGTTEETNTDDETTRGRRCYNRHSPNKRSEEESLFADKLSMRVS